MRQFHQFERPAADVAQHAVGVGEAEQHALGRQAAFLLAGQHADHQIRQAGAKGGDEGGAVVGVAHRGGGQDLDRVGAHRAAPPCA